MGCISQTKQTNIYGNLVGRGDFSFYHKYTLIPLIWLALICGPCHPIFTLAVFDRTWNETQFWSSYALGICDKQLTNAEAVSHHWGDFRISLFFFGKKFDQRCEEILFGSMQNNLQRTQSTNIYLDNYNNCIWGSLVSHWFCHTGFAENCQNVCSCKDSFSKSIWPAKSQVICTVLNSWTVCRNVSFAMTLFFA